MHLYRKKKQKIKLHLRCGLLFNQQIARRRNTGWNLLHELSKNESSRGEIENNENSRGSCKHSSNSVIHVGIINTPDNNPN